ncbi:MAG TPA: tetratricopeptide repeat protein [Thermoanaerobaculia bacterium]|jgi:tetratricopeptide (TPR) repeat protein
MTKKFSLALSLVFTFGIAVGAMAARKGVDTSMFKSKPKKEAAQALLALAKTQAGKGSWERIAVGRVYYLGGMKAEGQAIFDGVTAKKPESSDWFRIGRVYREAGEWTKAQEAFDKAMKMEPNEAKWLAEVGAYYLAKGDRDKAEQYFDQSFRAADDEVWCTVNMAAGYLGVEPLQ